jgi:hypothetical protein
MLRSGGSNASDDKKALGDRSNRASSVKKGAKDIYLSKSRYVPGIKSPNLCYISSLGISKADATNNNQNGAASNGYANARLGQLKQNSASQARSALQARFEYAYG